MKIEGVVLLNADGVLDKAGDYLDKTSMVSVLRQLPIPVVAGHNGWPVGKVTNFYVDGTQFKINIELDQSFSSNLNLLKPSFQGKCHRRDGRHIVECELLSVELTPFNVDDRIPALGSYLKYEKIELPAISPLKIEKECKCHSILFGHEQGCAWNR